MTTALTPLELTLLEELYRSSAGNGHDFGFTEDGIGIVGKKQLGGVLSSLEKKGFIDIDSEGVKTDSGTWHQFEFCYGTRDKNASAALVRKLLDEHNPPAAPVETFNDKAARIAEEHKLHPVDAAMLADVIEPAASDDCYVVIIHNEDWTIAELTAVPAKAARFARRLARKEWLAAGNSDDGIEFNARSAGPDNS